MARQRVILAEDNFGIALHMTAMLEDLGCEVVARASAVADAETAAATQSADCAILDVGLADGRCYGAATIAQSRGMPVIFTTGYDVPPDMPDALAGAPCLLKPVDLHRLRRALQRVCEVETPGQ